VPASAEPGQTLTMIGYQRRGSCSDTTVYVDLRPVGHQVVAVVNNALPDWDGVVLSVRLPDDVTPGPHVVTLMGALPGRGRSGELDPCADESVHTGVVASALLNVQRAN
jgi:hypothetical protein